MPVDKRGPFQFPVLDLAPNKIPWLQACCSTPEWVTRSGADSAYEGVMMDDYSWKGARECHPRPLWPISWSFSVYTQAGLQMVEAKMPLTTKLTPKQLVAIPWTLWDNPLTSLGLFNKYFNIIRSDDIKNYDWKAKIPGDMEIFQNNMDAANRMRIVEVTPQPDLLTELTRFLNEVGQCKS